MINIPRLATGGTVNIHDEPPLFVLERVKGFPNLLFRECPAFMGQTGHNGGLEVLMPPYGFLVVAKTVSEQCQCQLRRATAAVAPLEPGDTVFPQVKPGIQGNSIDAN